MDSNSPSIVNGRNLNFRDMEEMIAFWEELEMVENTTVVGSVCRRVSFYSSNCLTTNFIVVHE